jgi:membrane protease YdiL (CAAX protease family)
LYHAAPGPALSVTNALLLVLAALATLIAAGLGAVALGAPDYAALGIGQLGMLGLALVVVRVARLPVRALGIAAAPARFLLAGALIGVSAWYLNMALVELLLPEEQIRQGSKALARVVERPPLALAVLAIGLAPAVCEEVLFRGALLRALASRLPLYAALLIGSAMFSIYHVRPVQMPATFTLGLVFGVLALRTGSILPSALAHFLNNAVAIVVARRESDALSRGLERHPELALIGFGAVFVIGLGLAIAAPPPGVREGAAP